MSAQYGAAFVSAAFQARIPFAAVYFKCRRNWRIPANRAEQIADEASAEAYRRSLIVEFDDEIAYRRWVIRVGCNCAADLLRRDGRTRSISDDPVAPSSLPKTAIASILDQACNSLDPTEREIIRLIDIEGLTFNEAAEQLIPDSTKSPNARRLQLWRKHGDAIKKIRLYLANNGFDAEDLAAR